MSALRLIGRLGLGLLLAAAVLLARPPSAAQAVPTATDWVGPVPIVDRQTLAAVPSIAFKADGSGHAVWEGTEGYMYYASRSANGPWSAKQRALVGQQPSLAARSNGTLYMVFHNVVIEHDDIFYSWLDANGRWVLPRNVSNTAGTSDQPVLLATPDGKLHAAWRDAALTSGGMPSIYYGQYDGAFWSSEPVPSAYGEAPSLAAAPDGTIYLAWQGKVARDAAPSTFDIFVSRLLPGGTWSLPADVSDTPYVDSLGPTITSAADGLAHVAWVTGDRILNYAYGRTYEWSAPQTVAVANSTVDRPRLSTERTAILQLAWRHDLSIRATFAAPHTGQWRVPVSVVSSSNMDFRDTALATSSGGSASVAWVQVAGASQTGIFESVHLPLLERRVWMPLVLQN